MFFGNHITIYALLSRWLLRIALFSRYFFGVLRGTSIDVCTLGCQNYQQINISHHLHSSWPSRPHPPTHPTQADHWIVRRCRDPILSSVRTRQHASPGCGLNLAGGHYGHWWDAKQHENTMTWNFKRKCWNKKVTVFCLLRPLLLGGQTFHLQICLTLNASMQCPLRSKVSPLCPQPPARTMLKICWPLR